MGCCGSKDKVESVPQHEKPMVNWGGNLKRHTYTDIGCLIIFIVFLVVWAVIGVVSILQGDITKVLYPTDSLGRVCGTGELESRKYLLYFDLTRCLNPAVLAYGCNTPQVCVEKCPTKSLTISTNAEEMEPFCFDSSDPKLQNDKLPFRSKILDWTSLTPNDLVQKEICPAWVLPSEPFLGRCLPSPSILKDRTNVPIHRQRNIDNTKDISSENLNQAVSTLGAFLSFRDFTNRVANDLEETWWMILIALLCASVVSFIWIILMRFVTGIMVWTSIFILIVGSGGGLGYSVYRYLQVKDAVEGPQNIFEVNYTPQFLDDVLKLRDTWLAFTVILSIIFVVVLCLFIALRQRINLAIRMIEHGSKAVSNMLSSMFVPIIPFLLHAIIIVWFVGVGCYMASIGEQEYNISYDEDESDTFQKIKFNSNMRTQAGLQNVLSQITTPKCPEMCGDWEIGDQCSLADGTFNETACSSCDPPVLCRFTKYTKQGFGFVSWMQWFNLFGFYWAMNFITAYGEIILAGVFAKWYWTKHKSDIPVTTVCSSIFNATVYHLGTIAFGSLIIAIIKFIRAIVSYIESKLKKASGNDLVRGLLCACKCCLWMLEKFMKFINRNAYIVCAIKSTNFCTSSREAFSLIINNPVRTFVLNKMVDFLLFVGKVVIVVGSGVTSYFAFSGWFPELASEIPTLNYFFTPILFITVGTYFITSSFFSVYAMAVDTIFLSFLQDLKQNDGSPQKPYIMEKALQDTVGVMQKFREEELKRRQQILQEQQNKLSGMLITDDML